MEDAFKGFVKKLNNPFASSSRFKGEGHRLGGGESRSDSAAGADGNSQSRRDGAGGEGDAEERRRRAHEERWAKAEGGGNRDKVPGPGPSLKLSALKPSSVDRRSEVQEGSSEVSPSKAFQGQSIRTSAQDYSLARNENMSASLPSNGIDNGLGPAIGGNTASFLAADGIDKESRGVTDENTAIDLARNGIDDEVGGAINGSTSSNPASNDVNNELGGVIGGNTLASDGAGNQGEDALDGKVVTSSARTEESFDTSRLEDGNRSGFDPFSPHIGSKSSSAHDGSSKSFQCPVCGSVWRTENEVNTHVDECLRHSSSPSPKPVSDVEINTLEESRISLDVFLSGGPSSDTITVILKILQNIVNNPELEKYRKIRLGNKKIHDTIGTALGGVELLMAVGFCRKPEEDEVWAVMAIPSNSQLEIMKDTILRLEGHLLARSKEGEGGESLEDTEKVHSKVDRQVRVFYPVSENLAARMDIPDSFYNLSAAELRQEAASRRKRLEDSQLLVSRVSREKASKRKYKAAIIRIQFPDGVVLQGTFLPWEPTSAIYEFVASALRDPAIEFDLIAPTLRKNQVVSSSSQGSTKAPTLEEASLVPATLMKFKCSESDSLRFTGLHPDFLTMMEPLSATGMHS